MVTLGQSSDVWEYGDRRWQNGMVSGDIYRKVLTLTKGFDLCKVYLVER